MQIRSCNISSANKASFRGGCSLQLMQHTCRRRRVVISGGAERLRQRSAHRRHLRGSPPGRPVQLHLFSISIALLMNNTVAIAAATGDLIGASPGGQFQRHVGRHRRVPTYRNRKGSGRSGHGIHLLLAVVANSAVVRPRPIIKEMPQNVAIGFAVAVAGGASLMGFIEILILRQRIRAATAINEKSKNKKKIRINKSD